MLGRTSKLPHPLRKIGAMPLRYCTMAGSRIRGKSVANGQWSLYAGLVPHGGDDTHAFVPGTHCGWYRCSDAASPPHLCCVIMWFNADGGQGLYPSHFVPQCPPGYLVSPGTWVRLHGTHHRSLCPLLSQSPGAGAERSLSVL